MILLPLAAGALLLSSHPIQAKPVKAPVVEYNKVRDQTLYGTGEHRFRRSSTFWFSAAFLCRGKEMIRPESIRINFSVRRMNSSGDAAKDADTAEWANVREVVLRWSAEPATFRPIYQKIVDTDAGNQALIGRSFFEVVHIDVPTATFVELATSKELLLQVGSHSDKLGEGQLKPMKQLAESLPPAKP